MGLNLQNEDKSIAESSKEIRYRVWWALCSTERMLAVMTGRPTSFLDAECSTPLPLPIEEDALTGGLGGSGIVTAESLRRYSSQESKESDPSASVLDNSPKASSTVGTLPQQSDGDAGAAVPPSDALFFLCHTKLSVLTNVVVNRLYRASASKQTWAETQSRIAKLDAKLERWRRSLPAIFDFTKKQREQQFIRQRMFLGFFYYNTRTIINRPCLCRVDRRIPHESGKAREFNRTAAARCVHAARDLVAMLPREPNVVGLYRVSPWWCLVHHLVQATTVLMLELSFRAYHTSNEAEEIFEAAKKAVNWLRSMSEDNIAARRAWTLCGDLLRKVAPNVGQNANDLPDGVAGSDARFMSQDTSMEAGPSKYPAQPSTPSYYDRGHGLTLPSQTDSAYDEFLTYDTTAAPFSLPQFSSIFPSMNQMEAMLSSASANLDGSFADAEQQWDVDGHQQH